MPHSEALENLESLVAETIGDLLAVDRDAKTQFHKQLQKLKVQEKRFIELVTNGTHLPSKIRSKIAETTIQKEAVKEKPTVTTAQPK